MSAPEPFQVGDTVRCVDAAFTSLTAGAEYVVVKVRANYVTVRGDERAWYRSRFVLVPRSTPPALDPFAWTDLAGHLMGNPGIEFDLRIKRAPFITAWVAWSRFCYWATSVNLAARILPTQPAARTRASNGRDVPVATVLVELPVDVAQHYSDAVETGVVSIHDYAVARQACRRALGGGA